MGARAHQVEHDVKVVNHQVKHYAIIFDARLEGAHASALDEDRVSDDVFQLLHSPIEPLYMPNMEHDTAPISQLEQFLGFRQRRRNRLLDEHMYASVKKFTGNLGMQR